MIEEGPALSALKPQKTLYDNLDRVDASLTVFPVLGKSDKFGKNFQSFSAIIPRNPDS
jgi:hypothetical protein